ncbi:MAG TPA: sigma-70 family RNA polymerase sigma factor [Pseudonocardiaceae bacterium]|nr:sigma-70 family RNA polymerase sigma factor [Pseudonocardiaceae bacterium]
MSADDELAIRFEAHRGELRAVAYRMLGSLHEADDAIQETWLRLAKAGDDGIVNLGAWLTTVVGRVCLDMLRARGARREDPVGAHLPDPILSSPEDGVRSSPEDRAVQADSVGFAMMVILDTLDPAERLAFVLHDLFAVPFEQVAPIVGRTPAATRQLASRARRRVRQPDTAPDLARPREVIDAFLAASRGGDVNALLELLDPDVVLRADVGPGVALRVVRGAERVAGQAMSFRRLSHSCEPVLVNGAPGLRTAPNGRLTAILAVTVGDGGITEIHILADPVRLAELQRRQAVLQRSEEGQ